METIAIFVMAAMMGLLLIGRCDAGVIGDKCPEVTPMPNFNIDKYSGTWYEIQRYPNHFEDSDACVKQILTGVNEDGVGKLSNVMKDSHNGEVVTRNATVRLPKNGASDGHLIIKYGQSNYHANAERNHIVLYTDYERYAVVWSCYQIGHESYSYAWILSRTKIVPQELSEIIQRYLKDSTPIETNKLVHTYQNCEDF